jgi:hypothetical protein
VQILGVLSGAGERQQTTTKTMKKHIPYIITLAVITGWAATTAPAQNSDSLLTDAVDQEEFPQVVAQPTDQVVFTGSNVVLSVQAANANGYQWRRNGAAIDGQTNSNLVIEQVVIEDAGSYSCDVSKDGGEAVPTRSASVSVETAASVSAASVSGGGPITVFGAPKVGGGSQGDCPGSYAGYISYTKTISQGWGWAPSTNTTTVFTATDGGGRTDTKIVYLGKNGDTGCDETTVPIPNPPYSPKYRFAIYFPNHVPTTNYPIILTGFNP